MKLFQSRERRYFYWFIAFIATFSGVVLGYDAGVISGAILFISKEFHLSTQLNGFVVSAVLIGSFCGAIFSGQLSDRFGRRRLLIVDSIIFLIGAILSSGATAIITLILGRIIIGIGIGISVCIVPVYVAEISPKKNRGALVSFQQLAMTVGILLAYLADYYFSFYSAWRSMLAAGIILGIVFLMGVLVLPESPRWVLSMGREKQALAILYRIHGYNSAISQELQQIQENLKQQTIRKWSVLFSVPIYRALIIGAGLAIFQQASGINTIIFYAPTILKMAGFHQETTAILATIGVGVILVITTLISIPLLDSIGRKPLLFIGISILSISLFILSWSFKHQTEMSLKWIALGSMVLFIIGFSISLGPVMWVMISEIFPLKIRGLGSSLVTALNSAANWAATASFLTLAKTIGASGIFLIYFVIGVTALFFVYFWVPETKGVSLEQIEKNLYAGKRCRFLGRN